MFPLYATVQNHTLHTMVPKRLQVKDRIGVNFMDWTSQNRSESDQEGKTELKEGNKAERASCVEEAQKVEWEDEYGQNIW